MADGTSGLYNLTVPAILCFPNLTEAKRFKGKNGKESGDPKYQATLMFAADHPDFKTIKGVAVSLAKAKWPGKDIKAEFDAKRFKMPWSAGEVSVEKRKKKLAEAGKEYDGKADFALGHFLIKTASKFAPRLAIIEGKKIIDLEGPAITQHKPKFFFGCEVLAQLNIVPYDAVGDNGTDGVTVYCNQVVSLNKGKRLAGGQSASEVFKDYAGKLSGEDPTASDDLGDADAF